LASARGTEGAVRRCRSRGSAPVTLASRRWAPIMPRSGAGIGLEICDAENKTNSCRFASQKMQSGKGRKRSDVHIFRAPRSMTEAIPAYFYSSPECVFVTLGSHFKRIRERGVRIRTKSDVILTHVLHRPCTGRKNSHSGTHTDEC
jgi:hypothetical protein